MDADTETTSNRQALINAVTGVLLGAAIVVIALRFISRHLSKAPLWWDDYLILFGGVCSPYLSDFPIGKKVAEI